MIQLNMSENYIYTIYYDKDKKKWVVKKKKACKEKPKIDKNYFLMKLD